MSFGIAVEFTQTVQLATGMTMTLGCRPLPSPDSATADQAVVRTAAATPVSAGTTEPQRRPSGARN